MPQRRAPKPADFKAPELERIERKTERVIREAIERGELRDLPGHGQPLAPDEVLAGDRWAAMRVLRNAHALPEWLELRREIEAERERLLRRIRAHQRWLESRQRALTRLPAERLLDASRATKARDLAFQGEIADAVVAANARIAKHNSLVRRLDLHLPPLGSARLFQIASAAADR